MTSYNPYASAASAHRYSERKDYGKNKIYQSKIADSSLFKFDILSCTKQAIVYSLGGDTWIDMIKINDDMQIPFKNRCSLKFESLFALNILIPEVIKQMERGDVSSTIIDDKSLLYLMSSKLYSSKKGRMGQVATMYANIRHKYIKDDGVLSEGVRFI